MSEKAKNMASRRIAGETPARSKATQLKSTLKHDEDYKRKSKKGGKHAPARSKKTVTFNDPPAPNTTIARKYSPAAAAGNESVTVKGLPADAYITVTVEREDPTGTPARKTAGRKQTTTPFEGNFKDGSRAVNDFVSLNGTRRSKAPAMATKHLRPEVLTAASPKYLRRSTKTAAVASNDPPRSNITDARTFKPPHRHNTATVTSKYARPKTTPATPDNAPGSKKIQHPTPPKKHFRGPCQMWETVFDDYKGTKYWRHRETHEERHGKHNDPYK